MSIAFGSPATSSNINTNMASKNVDNSLAGKQTVLDTTQSTDKDTGSIITEGGLGVEKNINAGGNISAVGSMSGSNLSGSNTGDVSIGTANGLSLAGQVISLAQSSGSTTGSLNSTDWTTFNAKEPAITVLPESKGGTNQSTYTTGDLLYASAANTLSKLPIGSANKVLTVIAGVPSWQTPSAAVAALAVTTKTANYTAATTDDVILCDTSSGGFTITLPTAVGNSGKLFYIKKISTTNNVTIDTTSSQTIDGNLTMVITGSGFTDVPMVSDGSNWFIL